MGKRLILLMVACGVMSVLSPPAPAEIVGVNRVVLEGSTLISATTADGYTVTAEELATGTTTVPGGGNAEYPPELADDFDFSNATSNSYPLVTVEFGGRNWTDTNGDRPDFFIFESGGNDSGNIQAIFPDNSLGQAIAWTTDDWGSLGIPGLWGTQVMHGLAFAVTDLLDADGNPLTNHAVIKGIQLSDTGVDPVCILAIAPPPLFKAFAPDPADGASGVTSPLLQWSPGDTAAFHEVYFGTSSDLGPADLAGPRSPIALYFHPMGLEPGTTYYWRVDEVEADLTTVHPGDVWSFTAAPATAYDPSPWDGAKGIDPNANLTWTGGVGAATHDVYFGTDPALVAARDASTAVGNIAAAAYDPDTLVEDTTYYWAVDEHDLNGATHAGDVWRFTTIAPTDGVKAEYFSGMILADEPLVTQVENAIDHQWGEDAIVEGLADGVSARWTAMLEPPFTETYTLITTSDDGVRLWLDGRLLINNWTNHAAQDNKANIDLIAGRTYSIRMEWYEDGGGATAQLSWQSSSIERQIIPAGALQLPLKAGMPSPADGAVDTEQSLLLGWSAGDNAAGHQVYFGDDARAVTEATPATAGIYRGQHGLDATAFDPGPLEWNKTYYWRVDEPQAGGAIRTGNVWSFTTADFLIVDDFERYGNEVGHRPFEVWIDGIGFSLPEPGNPGNGTGAAVGHDVWSVDGPHYNGLIMETGIVHTGGQSMPVDYNNANPPYYCEIERTWAVPQNWTVNGVDTLTIHVRGDAGNDAERLYVVLQDSAGRTATVACPDPVATTPKWAVCETPLSEFTGVNAAAVTGMTVGFGDRAAPAPGGTGTVYVDDVRIVRSVAP